MKRELFAFLVFTAASSFGAEVPAKTHTSRPAIRPKSPPVHGAAVGVGALFIGEDGGSPNPSPDANDFMEHNPRYREPAAANTRQSNAPPQTPRRPLGGFVRRDPAGVRLPQPEIAEREESAGSAPRDLEQGPEREASGEKGVSLWQGLSAPLRLPPEEVSDLPEDEASQLGRKDYDAHILGGDISIHPKGSLPSPSGVAKASTDGRQILADAARKAQGAPAGLFVGLHLDISASHQPDPVKEAVADLGRVAGFHADPRFEPAALDETGRKVSLWGWMPARKIGQAMKVLSVAQLRIENQGPRPYLEPVQTAEILIGIRMPMLVDAVADRLAVGAMGPLPRAVAPPPASPAADAETAARVIAQLEAETGFYLKKRVGYQAVPLSQEKALIVIGEVPIRNISRLMSNSDVIKIVPAASALDRLEEVPSPRGPISTMKRFFSFAKGRFPYLLSLTVLLIMLSPGRVLRRLSEIFIPYH